MERWWTGPSPDNLLHSRLIVLWGWNPAVTRFGPQTAGYLAKAKKARIKIICVDPRQNPTAQALADQWVPIRPGTDTALLVAMAHVMISEGLVDRVFIDKHTVGFRTFVDYVTGKEDGMAKTPGWAEPKGFPHSTREPPCPNTGQLHVRQCSPPEKIGQRHPVAQRRRCALARHRTGR
ncbi:MAG: molybdopterin-dependent oxidoreductase [Deltaproteobacteria bacterium]|nr:molybdopterin-dependent oxidoreductase [Deltaproteobacteria bacterium]